MTYDPWELDEGPDDTIAIDGFVDPDGRTTCLVTANTLEGFAFTVDHAPGRRGGTTRSAWSRVRRSRLA